LFNLFRCKYGAQLQAAIKSFLSEFVQHMKEEEAVFGPLLKENFERKELEDMNETVLKQHTLFREKVRQVI
jgi:iron-sulfur cluster repair protein YtfE (RIC family)